jgi:hypothetical protein
VASHIVGAIEPRLRQSEIARAIRKRYKEAWNWVEQSLHEQPRFAAAIRVKLSLCGHLGRAEEARHCLARLTEQQPDLTIATFTAQAATFLSTAVTEIFVAGLRRAGLREG